MLNVTIIFGLLVVPYFVATLFHLTNPTMAGRIGVCGVFLFTAIGHFFKTDSIVLMLPRFVPARRALIYLSGVVEILFAVAVVALPNPLYVGWAIIVYLIVIFPSNVYAAVQRISFGGHSTGPRYFTANLERTLISLEACSGSHILGRTLSQQGHDVRLIPAQFVKPFVKSNKNDDLDAEAIAEECVLS